MEKKKDYTKLVIGLYVAASICWIIAAVLNLSRADANHAVGYAYIALAVFNLGYVVYIAKKGKQTK